MSDQSKTRQELIDELTSLRQRITELNMLVSGLRPDDQTSCTLSTEEPGTYFTPPEGAETPEAIRLSGQATETIDLNSLLTKDITNSGSFDIRGDIWATTFGKVIQALPIAAVLIDKSFRITVANEAWKRITPDYQGILNSAYSSLFPSESLAQQSQCILERVFHDRIPRVAQLLLDVLGNKLWARMTFRSVRILKERFVLVLLEDLTLQKQQLLLNQKQQDALSKEIAERKKSEDALLESEARFRQIYDDAPVMMHCLDTNGIIRSANARWERDMRYGRNEVIGQSGALILTGESLPSFSEIMSKLWDQGEVRGVPLRYLKKDGAAIDVLVDLVTTKDPLWGAVALITSRDVTHELFLEKQLREAQKMEAVATLASGVAHDFNNILQVVLGFADLVASESDAGSDCYYRARSIREAAQRGAELVKQVLTFSRKVDTRPRPINLNTVLEQASRLLQSTIPKMIQIVVELADCPYTIHADPTQMEQIILNLAVNAKDAMPEGGRLTFRTENVTLSDEYCRKWPEVRPGDYVCLTAADTGEGIDAKDLQHIFEPFYTTKKPGEGTGLGLSMVFGIVKMHGGHITCESALRKGTVFQVYLPAVDRIEEPDVNSTCEMPALGTETLLLVDDEELVRKWAEEVLTQAGYFVLTAATGKEALEVYRASHSQISLVILDLIMPDMGGRHCLQELLRVDNQVKAVVASGFPVDRDTRQYLESHAKEIISKPFRAKELLRVVRKVLDEE